MPVFHYSLAPLFLVAAFIALASGLLFFIRFQTKLTGWAGVFSLTMAFDLAFYYLLLTSTTPDAMQFWFKILIITYSFLSIVWLFFVLLFTGHVQWINLRIIIIAGAIPILLAGILLLSLPEINPVWMNTIGSVTGWIRDHGLSGYLFAAYIFGIDFISMGLLIRMILNNHPYFRNLALFLYVGTLMIIMAGLLELGGSNPFAPISIVQLFKIVHSIMAFIGVFIFRGSQVLPVARDAAFKHIQDGLLVLDRSDNVVDLNPAAVQIIGEDEQSAIGKPIFQVWEQGVKLLADHPDISTIESEHTLLVNGIEQTFDISISPVLDANREGIGRVIVLHNVTRRNRTEKAFHERTSETETSLVDELTRSNSIILALSKIAAQLESSPNSNVIFETIGSELKKMGLDSMVGVLDDEKQNLSIRYISASHEIIRLGEKMIGRQLSELFIPRRRWPTQAVVDKRDTHWDLMRSTLNIFPNLPESMQITLLKMAGINLDDPVCYLPIATEHEVIGVLSIWGKGLKQNDIPALNILANQAAAVIRNSNLYEAEARRARELDILLKASESASSVWDLDTVLLRLASQLLDLSGFESCFISELNKETNLIHSRIDHSRIFWTEEKRDSYSLSDYPRSKNVLLTGRPIVLQGNFEAEEKQWMTQLGRTAVIILALYAQKKIIGLVEIASVKKGKLFSEEDLHKCEEIIAKAADSLIEPIPDNDPNTLFEIEKSLLQACKGDICSFSEWNQIRNRIETCAVYSEQVWKSGESPGISPDGDSSWKLALQEGKSSVWVSSEGTGKIEIIGDGTITIDIESSILFPLQKGKEIIGLVELYDFNHKTQVSPEQLTLLRTIADKASYWIENARLLEQTQKRLEEQTELLHEKEVLLKEIHHRVKNNLQVISSLLNLQARKVTDSTTKQLLSESQARVHSMALIHEKLYQSKGLAKIDFGEYVKSLSGELFRSYRRDLSNIQLVIQADEVALSLDQAVPCGLILNELITNTLKYAFPDGKNGILRVELRTKPESILSLRVADNGVGMPPNFDYRAVRSLGLQLVNSLVAQLDGELKVDQSAGTDFQVSFRYQ